MRIHINTTFTTYTKDTEIKPKALYWVIRNVGSSTITINDLYTMDRWLSEFGIDATDVLIPTMQNFIKNKGGIKVVNDTKITVRFGEPISNFLGIPATKFLLIETFFKIQK